jgi:hypothetical protein
MHKVILAIALCASFSAHALDTCLSGSWFNPERSGEGMDINITEDVVVAYWFGHLDGTAWFVAVGPNDGAKVQLDIYQTLEGGDEKIIEDKIGEMQISHDEFMLIDYQLHLDLRQLGAENIAIPWCLSQFCSGSWQYSSLLTEGCG